MTDYEIQHVKTAVRSPRANGQAERINKTVLASLKCSTKNDKEWDEALPQLQWCLNSQSNATTKQSPNNLVFNYKLKDVTTNRLIQAIQDDVEDDDIEYHSFRNEAVAELMRAEQLKWKQRFQTPRQYKEGDLIVITNVPSPTGGSHKLEPAYKGPYVVTKILPHDRYLVEDLPSSQRHQQKYAGVFSNDNMKTWCTIGPEDKLDDATYSDENGEDDEGDDHREGDDPAGTAELSTVARPVVTKRVGR